ncbi:MAG TPA: tetratricopeptide repeat protein, partial [Ktedonobacteraceae bacterium]|nr:tetratricopeptide repeat protein [Ktedonobacteraceae bacterium]
MEDSLLKALQATEDPLEKAALVAEAIFERLPRETTLAARRCIVLHWFDLSIVEALLEESELTIDEMNDIYEQLAALPFVDTIQSRLLFQNITRQGLLARYSLNQPELLRTAARLAAPIYEAREEDEKSIAEAFFCYRVSGDRKASVAIQNELFEQVSHQDWRRIENLLRLQDEAESLSFVQPLPRTELQFLLRGLVHRMNGEQEAAILDYNQSLSLNPKSTLAYINRGTTYAEQKRFDEALSDYNTALQIDKSVVQAYANRGVIYAKQARYAEALKDFERAIEAGLLNSFVLRNKSETLNELGRYEEALVTYDEILRLSPEDVEAYIGRGQSLNQLEDYEQALTSFEEALRFNPDSASACRGKGYALNGLERYVEALVAYDQALALDANSAEAYRGKGKALSSLKRYEEASVAYSKADQLDPQRLEGTVEDEDIQEYTTIQRHRRAISNNQKGSNGLGARWAQLFHLSPRQNTSNTSVRSSRGSTPRSFSTSVGRGFALVAICLIVLSFGLLSLSHNGTLTEGLVGNATATAQSISTATVSAKNHYATATVQSNITATVQSCINGAKGAASSTSSSACVLQRSSFNLKIQDINGLLKDSSSAINAVEQQVRSIPILHGRDVGLAIVYGGAPTNGDIGQAQEISKKIESVIQSLGQQGFAFSRTSYCDPLYLLGGPSNDVRVDVYLFAHDSSPTTRLAFNDIRFTLKVEDINALLNDSQIAIDNVKQ